MLMTEYSTSASVHSYAPSTFSEAVSGSCGSRAARVRTVRLARAPPGHAPPSARSALGFSIRGGREHGTGFFVSYVEPGSEGYRQGLRAGDQIIRVNGFTVDDAVHKELLQLISCHTHLTLKVRSVGMIPVKDKKTDSLTWQIINDSNSSLSSSPQLGDKIQDIRISIMVAPRSKLGCGICKGPEWKPGIFIQFTKEGGIAREAGLRPGDQIMYCNSVDFSDIPFNEAVNLMKSSRQLDLLVRKGAASELFPGESSGYNSSASSVTGDQSPSWSESKRLSIVKEETLELEDRLLRWGQRLSKGEALEKSYEEKTYEEKPYFKPTVIRVSESGTTITSNGPHIEEVKNDGDGNVCVFLPPPQQQQTETKMVVAEVHRSDQDDKSSITNALMKSPSIGSFNSSFSNTGSSLSSAICQEIQRRSEKQHCVNVKPSIDEQLQKSKILKGIVNENQQQHSKLMDEFRKAHRKMFKAPEAPGETSESSSNNQLEKFTQDNENKDRLSNGKELSHKLTERLSSLSLHQTRPEHQLQPRPVSLPNGVPKPNQNDTSKDRVNGVINKSQQLPPPPPPPQPPADECDSRKPTIRPASEEVGRVVVKATKTKPRAPPVPVKVSSLSSQPPPCPTPDYDTLSISSAHSTLTKQNGCYINGADTADMASLASYQLHTPYPTPHPPPDTYFTIKTPLSAKHSTGSSTSTDSSGSTSSRRPGSITIGEYPSATLRKPGKLNFLAPGQGESTAGQGETQGGSVAFQLAEELAMTLDRSNLKRRTESMEDLLGSSQINSQMKGSVRINLRNLSRNFAKSTNDLTAYGTMDQFSRPFYNKVSINVGNSESKDETGNDTPNGILKTNHPFPHHHKQLIQQKSITFGETPTVISEQTLHAI